MEAGAAQQETWIERTAAGAARAWDAELKPKRPTPVALARYALKLALNPRSWVRRRVETFEFLDADTVRRRMSVDFELPESSRLDAGATVYVPLMVLTKRDLRNFNMRDEEGRALSVLNSEENGDVVTRGLLVYLYQEAEPTEEHAQALRDIVKGRPRAGERRAEAALEAGGALRDLVDTVPKHRDSIASLIEQLDHGFLLLVGLTYEPRARRVLKFSYDVEHRPIVSTRRIARLWARSLRLGASFGFLPRIEKFEDLVVGLGATYHAEAVAPADTYVEDARLEVAGRPPDVDPHRYRPHMHVESHSPGDRGSVTLRVHAQREGLMLPLLLAATAISATLAFVPGRADSLDGQTLAALLLVPFALAAFFIRSAENSYVTRMLRGVRLVATVPVAAGVLTIAMLGLGHLDPDSGETDGSVRAIAEWAAGASVAATALLAVAALAPSARRAWHRLAPPVGPWSVAQWLGSGLAVMSLTVSTVVGLLMLARALADLT